MAKYNRKQKASSVCEQAGLTAKCKKGERRVSLHVWDTVKGAFIIRTQLRIKEFVFEYCVS